MSKVGTSGIEYTSTYKDYCLSMNMSWPPSKESYESLYEECKVVARSIPSSVTIEAHSHAWIQFLYAKEGAFFLYLATSGERILVSPQQGILIPPELVHTVETGTNVELLSLYIPSELCDFYSDKAFILRVNQFLKLSLIEAESYGDKHYDQQGKKLLFDLIINRLKNAQTLYGAVPMPHDRRILQGIFSIGLKSVCMMSKHSFADCSNVSESTLSRIIRSDTNLSYRQWKSQIAVQVAIDEMLSGKNVSTISSELGYDSPSSFIHMFKNMTGVSPARFIHRMKE